MATRRFHMLALISQLMTISILKSICVIKPTVLHTFLYKITFFVRCVFFPAFVFLLFLRQKLRKMSNESVSSLHCNEFSVASESRPNRTIMPRVCVFVPWPQVVSIPYDLIEFIVFHFYESLNYEIAFLFTLQPNGSAQIHIIVASCFVMFILQPIK